MNKESFMNKQRPSLQSNGSRVYDVRHNDKRSHAEKQQARQNYNKSSTTRNSESKCIQHLRPFSDDRGNYDEINRYYERNNNTQRKPDYEKDRYIERLRWEERNRYE